MPPLGQIVNDGAGVTTLKSHDGLQLDPTSSASNASYVRAAVFSH